VYRKYKLRLPLVKNRGFGYPYDNFVQLWDVARDPLSHQPHTATANVDHVIFYHAELQRILGPWGNEFPSGDKTTDLPAGYANYVPHLNSYEEFRMMLMKYYEWRIAHMEFQIETKYPYNESTGGNSSGNVGTTVYTPLANPFVQMGDPITLGAVEGFKSGYVPIFNTTQLAADGTGREFSQGESTAVAQMRFPDYSGMRKLRNYRKLYLKSKKTYSWPLNFVSLHCPLRTSVKVADSTEWIQHPFNVKRFGITRREFNPQKYWMLCKDHPHTEVYQDPGTTRRFVEHVDFDDNMSTIFRLSHMPILRTNQNDMTKDDYEKMFQFYIVVEVAFRGKKIEHIGDRPFTVDIVPPMERHPIGTNQSQLSSLFAPSVPSNTQGEPGAEGSHMLKGNTTNFQQQSYPDSTTPASQFPTGLSKRGRYHPYIAFDVTDALTALQAAANFSGFPGTGTTLFNIVQLAGQLLT